VQYGSEAIHLVTIGLASDAEGRRSLAIEMLDLTLDRSEAALAAPVLRTDLPDGARLDRLSPLAPDAPGDRAATLADIVEDAEEHWRSPWLSACAVYEARGGGSFAASRRFEDDRVLRETLDWAARRAGE
jgi:hypothetical protein